MYYEAYRTFTFWEADQNYDIAKLDELIHKNWYELNYGTQPVKYDATGRMIDSGPLCQIPKEPSELKTSDNLPIRSVYPKLAQSLGKINTNPYLDDGIKSLQRGLNLSGAIPCPQRR